MNTLRQGNVFQMFSLTCDVRSVNISEMIAPPPARPPPPPRTRRNKKSRSPRLYITRSKKLGTTGKPSRLACCLRHQNRFFVRCECILKHIYLTLSSEQRQGTGPCEGREICRLHSSIIFLMN